MEFCNPSAGWLLLLLIPLYYFTRNSLCDLPKWRFITSLVLRTIIFLLIIAAIAEIQLVKPNEKLCVIFVADTSKSISDKNSEDINAFIKKALEEKPVDDEAGLIVFGGNSYVEFIPSDKPSVSEFTSLIDTNHTDISQALRLALAMFPGDSNKRILLLTDGRENMGDALGEALLVASNKVPVDVVPIDSSLEREVFIRDFHIPETVNIDEPFEARIILESTGDIPAKLQFYRDGKLMGEEALSLQKGKNVFLIPQEVQEGGFYSYEVQLLAEKGRDTLADNNRAFAYTRAYGKPSVLLVEGEIGEASFLVKALEHEGINIDAVSYDRIPSDMAELQNYRCLILSDISSTQLSYEQMLQIQSYVRDLGGGFIMIGGENSFGVGGYYNTPVEETLPLSMDIRKDRHMPTMALVLVIDKSGSMADFGQAGVEKIALAREAAIASVDLLSPSDQIGVIGFDDAAKWVAPFQKRTDNKEGIVRDIASMRAGGGTNIYPALLEAERVLSQTEAILKHVILLSDGRSAPGNFDSIVQNMNSQNITLSCVGIGQDADIPFLQSLAEKGGGRLYHTTDVSLLPRIFTKEALLASRAAIIEEEFYPVIKKHGSLIDGIEWNEVPPLGGYVVATAKTRAEVFLVTPEDEDPLLARWYYGIGKSLAFTSDAKTRWGAEWIKWKYFPSFWSQCVRWSMRDDENPFLDLSVTFEDGEGKIIVDAITAEGEFMNLLDLEGRVISPDFVTTEVPLRQEGPGRYEATFPCKDVGTYFINAGGEEVGYQTAGFSYSISPEYKTLGPDTFLLGGLARDTGGRLLSLKGYNQVFKAPQEKSFQVKEIWPFLIMLALLLWPLDIAIRRVFLPDNWQETLKKRFLSDKKPLKTEERADLERLKKRKAKVVDQREEKVAPLFSRPTSGKGEKLKFIQEESPREVKVVEVKEKEIVQDKAPEGLDRLKMAKKKARDDLKKEM